MSEQKETTAVRSPVLKRSETDAVVEDILFALQAHSSDRLRRVREKAYETNAEGWLPKMLAEYLDVWR